MEKTNTLQPAPASNRSELMRSIETVCSFLYIEELALDTLWADREFWNAGRISESHPGEWRDSVDPIRPMAQMPVLIFPNDACAPARLRIAERLDHHRRTNRNLIDHLDWLSTRQLARLDTHLQQRLDAWSNAHG